MESKGKRLRANKKTSGLSGCPSKPLQLYSTLILICLFVDNWLNEVAIKLETSITINNIKKTPLVSSFMSISNFFCKGRSWWAFDLEVFRGPPALYGLYTKWSSRSPPIPKFCLSLLCFPPFFFLCFLL